MKYPKPVICPQCLESRTIDFRHLWLIKKGRITAKCFRCSRLKRGQINSGSFKNGLIPEVVARGRF